jgi:hypothetical protein
VIVGKRTPEGAVPVYTGPSPNVGRAGAPLPPSGFRGSGTPRGGFGRARKAPPAPKKRPAPKPSDYAGQGLDHAEAQVLIEMGIAPNRVADLAKRHAPGHPAAGPPDRGGGAGTPTPSNVPGGPGNAGVGVTTNPSTPGQYAANVLAEMGVPDTKSNEQLLMNQMQIEGMPGSENNPLATSLPVTGSSAVNSAGVQAYPTLAAGAQAEAATLSQPNMATIKKVLQSGTASAQDYANALASSSYEGSDPTANAAYAAKYLAAAGSPAASGVVDPAGAGLTLGRTDQGVDWRGTGPLYATGAGTIESVKTGDTGWPGGTFIDLRLANPPDPSHSDVYYAEDINPAVKAGEQVAAGQQVGTATVGSSGIELGWGNPAAIGQPLNQVTQGAYGGTGATPQGQSFLDYISGGSAGAGGTVDTGAGGGGGGTGAAGSTTGTTGAQAIADAGATNLFANLPNLYGVGTTGQSAQSLQQALSGLAANPEAATQLANTTNAPGSPDQPASESEKTKTPTAAQYQAILQALLPGITPGSAGKNG